jgi:hypothetical protein
MRRPIALHMTGNVGAAVDTFQAFGSAVTD